MDRLGVVTGGARGIGLAIVEALLDQDVVDEVAVLDLEPAELERATVYTCDVTDEASVRAAYAKIGRPPTVLVNNAGGGDINRIGQVAPTDPFSDIADFRSTVDLNFTSAHIVTSVIGPHLERGASICNTASIAGQMPGRLFAYGAAKAALIHWSKSLAQALASEGIRVNAIAPGIIRTRLWEALEPDDQAYDQMARTLPLGSDQSAENIADAVAFLCSDRAAQITGQVIAIDGGITLGGMVRR